MKTDRPFRAVAALLATCFLIGLAGAPALAEEGETTASQTYRNGAAALRLGDVPAAFEMFTTACASGSGQDCYQLADLYRRGLGTPQDFDKAADLYGESCELGTVAACQQLANMYFEGDRIGEDKAEARRLYARTCDLNEPAGCAVLGNMMYVGLGGPTDRNRGAELMRQACRAEIEYACGQVRRYGLSNDGSRSGVLDRGFWRNPS